MNAGDVHQLGRNDSRIVAGLDIGDELHLRESALSLRAEESVLFYRFALSNANVISPIEAVTRDVTVAVPNPDDLQRPTTQPMKEHFWRSEVLAAGSVMCEMDLIVLASDETILGYFRWHTHIDIAAV